MSAQRRMFGKGNTPRKVLNSGFAVIKLESSDGFATRWRHLSYVNLQTWHAELLPSRIDEENEEVEA